MRFATLLASAAVLGGVTAANPLHRGLDLKSLLGIDLSQANHYGAPIPPWNNGAHPGWYFGDHPHSFPDLTRLQGFVCKILKLFPHCLQCPPPPPPPSPSDGYHQTFSNLTGATQAGDYMTFGLVDTVDQCKAMCNSVSGCNFVNTYHDVNGKDGSTQLSCSLFTGCHDNSDATNTGGQTQPDGSINYIANSDGWCKDTSGH